MKKGNLWGVIGVLLFVAIAGTLFGLMIHHDNDKERTALAKEVARYGPRNSPQTIDDLKKALAAYEKMIDLHVQDAAQAGVYWQILGTRFREKEMYLDASDAFEHAIQYTPDDASLHYLLGLCAGNAAKSLYDTYNRTGQQSKLNKSAENAFLRAIELEPDYVQARYALATLYAFNMNEPQNAITQLATYLQEKTDDADAMFLMGREYYALGQKQQAISWYQKGIQSTTDEASIAEAQKNIDTIERQR
jgi:tetratricopeptide (TPR) repeat protein